MPYRERNKSKTDDLDILSVKNPKSIDPNLSSLVEQIAKQSQSLSVLAARQFRYKLLQTPVDIIISEPRKFNVLEEFILRASIEFEPPPTVKELADVLGLDLVFVQSTIENLSSLKSLKVSPAGSIQITPQGREFYKQGSVSQAQQSKQVYAIADPFQENLTFEVDALLEGIVDLPDLTQLVPIENNISDIDCLTIVEIQQLIQASGLGLHVPENGKIVTNCHVAGEPQPCWQTISIFVLFDVIENKYIIQVRRGKQILEKASNWFAELEAQQKFSLNDLCNLTEEVIDAPEKFVSQLKPISQTKLKNPKFKPPSKKN